MWGDRHAILTQCNKATIEAWVLEYYSVKEEMGEIFIGYDTLVE